MGWTTDLNMQLEAQEAGLAANLHMQLRAEAFQETALALLLIRDCMLSIPDVWGSSQHEHQAES